MSEERVYKLMTLVLLCKHQREYIVTFEIRPDYETITVFTPGEHWRYSSDDLESYEDEKESGLYHGIHDENLEKAEEHLLKILKVKEDT